MTNLEALLILNATPSCNARKVRLLLDAVGEARAILEEEHLRFIGRTGSFGARLVHAIRDRIKTFDPIREQEECKQCGIDIISFLDAAYPSNLLEIHDPPVLLYVKGKVLPQDDSAVSIVGSRSASFYGRDMAERIAFELASRGVTVVSGMARGIDSAAHGGALRAQGRTLAVLGSGIDIVYPSENKKLYERIAQSGALISEYPLHTPPHAYNFPKRNRIISGLSRGTVVVEAAQRSGSLITARLALDEGREVYSVPGKADALRSYGTNNLIKQGARLITDGDEIIDDLFGDGGFERKNSATAPKNDSHHGADKDDTVLSCVEADPIYIEELTEVTHIPRAQVCSVLTRLEIAHKVQRVFGGGYVRGSRINGL